MYLQQIDVTGCRLVGAITKALGMHGPKHHAIILGKDALTGEIYIAELMDRGYQVATFKDFQRRYSNNGDIRLEQNNGPSANLQVAQRALVELRNSKVAYDLVLNNCENFANRSMHGKSESLQIVNTALGIATLVGLYYVMKNSQ